MQIGEQQLAASEHAALDGLRFLDLDDHVGAIEYLRRRRGDRCTRTAVGVVVHPDALPGACLDDHVVPVRACLAHALRRQADAVLEDLDLLGYADVHRGSALLERDFDDCAVRRRCITPARITPARKLA